LTTILGFAQSAMRRLPKDDPLAFPLASIERESLRCKALIQDLLTFSRQSAATVASFDVDSLLNATILLVKGRAIAQSVEIRLEAPDAPLLVDGAPPQIQQVLINLCHNAIDAMPSGGTLTLRAGPVEDGGKRFARIEVLDTGTGIPPEIRDRVIEPFFTTKEPGQGTGIGLSIAYEIVRQHQGRISFESEVGRGTRFQVLLPAAAPLTPQETRHESPSQDPGRR
jgi:two-component system cell cycle sensor histidine kinase/response regulator CckA